MRRQTFPDGAVIFREGEVSDAAYLLISGVVKVVQDYETPHEKTIALVGKEQTQRYERYLKLSSYGFWTGNLWLLRLRLIAI